MVICDACKEKNTLDGNFCRACGAKLPEDARTAALADNQETVAAGQSLFGTGRIAEARLMAESVVDSDPHNVAALALLGDCLEREGLYSEALRCYEVVVGLNPDSALDRIRLSQIRKKLAAPSRNGLLGDRTRTLTILASVAAAVLLFSAGTAIVLATRPKDSATASASADPTLGERLPFTGPSPIPQGNGQVAPPETENANSQSPVTEMTGPAARTAEQGDTGAIVRRDSRAIGGPSIQNPVTAPRGPIAGSYRPVDPFTVTPERLPSTNVGSSTPANPDDPKPVTSGSTGANSGNTRRAVVEIRPSNTGGTNVGGSTTMSDRDRANEAETLLRVGRQHQMSGDNGQASAAYERALKAGADPATTNQRLAQVYEKQGRKGEAAAAYRKAGAAFDKKLQDGKGDKKLLEAQAESCKQAAKLLGG